MSDYSATLTITVPIAQRETGKRISRALDPDIGGYGAFNQFLDSNLQPCLEDDITATYVTYSSPCTQEFKVQADYMLTAPVTLCAAVEADYLTRWPDYTAPTLDQCTEFCASILHTTNVSKQNEPN